MKALRNQCAPENCLSFRRRRCPKAFICDGVRTPIGRYAGGLAKVRTDDLGALPIKALMKRIPRWIGPRSTRFISAAPTRPADNRNVARMVLLLAGLPDSVPGITVNRLCSSGLKRGGSRGAGDSRGRDRFRDRRRRRVDDARSACHGQGPRGVSAQRPNRGHDDRLGASSIR